MDDVTTLISFDISLFIVDSTQKAVEPVTNCPTGFQKLNGVCFGIVGVPSGSTAESACTANNARIAAITSPYENAFLRVMFNRKLSFTATSDEKAWLGGRERAGKFTWDTGCFPGYNKIADFYDNQQGENCVAFNYDGTWSTQPCNTAINFTICETRDGEQTKQHGTLLIQWMHFQANVASSEC